jgi:hypothetical protein
VHIVQIGCFDVTHRKYLYLFTLGLADELA